MEAEGAAVTEDEEAPDEQEVFNETLAAYLLERYAEDESLARHAFADHNEAGPDWSEQWSGAVNIGDHEDLITTFDSAVSRHIVNWDPARALREVEAKREIVKAVSGLTGQWYDDIEDRVLRALAQPYADRDDFPQEL